MIVVVAVLLAETLAFGRHASLSRFRNPSLKLSLCGFTHGLPGVMQSFLTPRWRIHAGTAAAINSGHCRCGANFGVVPRSATAPQECRIPSLFSMGRSTSNATLSRLISSQVGSRLSRRPSSAWSEDRTN